MSKENQVIEAQFTKVTSGLTITDRNIADAKDQIKLLKSFVADQMREGIDFGVIPGTDKPSLFKPGAEKFSKMFGLGVRFVSKDKEFDLDANFAMFSYMAEVYNVQTGAALAQCEGSCNSQEKKYRARKVSGSLEATPIADIMNTLQKMAQKRAYVGAIIQATGASDFFTQDIDSPEEAAALGLGQGAKKVAATITPKATAARSSEQSSEVVPQCCGKPMMISQFIDQQLGHAPYYCKECKSKKPRL